MMEVLSIKESLAASNCARLKSDPRFGALLKTIKNEDAVIRILLEDEIEKRKPFMEFLRSYMESYFQDINEMKRLGDRIWDLYVSGYAEDTWREVKFKKDWADVHLVGNKSCNEYDQSSAESYIECRESELESNNPDENEEYLKRIDDEQTDK
jgi:hypothetical protein